MALTSVDGLATSSGAGPITGLDEEVWDDSVSPYGKRINLGCCGSGFSGEKEMCIYRWNMTPS